MSKLVSAADLQERLAIAERAIADATVRINELSHALGEIAQTPEGDEVSRKALAIGADTVSPFSTGFYQREYDAAGRAYRWTGRGNLFELRIRLSRSFGWDFVMELQQNAHVDVAQLRGFVDYIEVPVEISAPEALVRGTIPARPFGRHAVLTFLLPNLFVPSQISSESSDTRSLGLVFYALRAAPAFQNEERPPASSAAPSGPGAASAGSSAAAFVHQGATGNGFLQKARASLAAGGKKLF